MSKTPPDGSRDLDALIARAAADPPMDPIPPDFARRTAALALQRADEGRLEKAVERGLWAVLVVAGFVSLGIYGGQWARVAAMLAPDGDTGSGAFWMAAIGGCVLLTFAFQVWTRPARR